MRRVSHDLPGVKQRLSKLASEFEFEIQEAKQVWRDSKGQAFFQQHTTEIKPIVNQLTTSLAQAIELVDRIAKRLRDPDKE